MAKNGSGDTRDEAGCPDATEQDGLPKGLYCGIICSWMRKGFTLVEMLIVVVVLVTLMTMAFRLSSIGSTSARRNTTVARLQRLENCLSGYYAAFGTYPPVALHGSRSPYQRVNAFGIQKEGDGNKNESIFNWDPAAFRSGSRTSDEAEAWEQVEAACKAQPVDCKFPYPENDFKDYIKAKSDQLKELAEDDSSGLSEARRNVLKQGFDDGVSNNPNRYFGGDAGDSTSWRDVQLFQFGLMSYLLPRLLVMTESDELLYRHPQWTENNVIPRSALDGKKFMNGWNDVIRYARDYDSNDKTGYAKVANIPSQAVCARWMANLEGIVSTPHSRSVFGVSYSRSDDNAFSASRMEIHRVGDANNNSSGGEQYVLDYCTVRDGWENEFYYYSPAPYQSYVLWSAGPNGRTFPPWISREGLGSRANECIGAWIEDDITGMSH